MTSKENPSGWTAALGQVGTDVSMERNNINLTDDCQALSGQALDYSGSGDKHD